MEWYNWRIGGIPKEDGFNIILTHNGEVFSGIVYSNYIQEEPEQPLIKKYYVVLLGVSGKYTLNEENVEAWMSFPEPYDEN